MESSGAAASTAHPFPQPEAVWKGLFRTSQQVGLRRPRSAWGGGRGPGCSCWRAVWGGAGVGLWPDREAALGGPGPAATEATGRQGHCPGEGEGCRGSRAGSPRRQRAPSLLGHGCLAGALAPPQACSAVSQEGTLQPGREKGTGSAHL